MAAGYDDKSEHFVEHLARGISWIAASQYLRPALVRLSDFKTNEYADLIGGKGFEPSEANPMLGFRGASRYRGPSAHCGSGKLTAENRSASAFQVAARCSQADGRLCSCEQNGLHYPTRPCCPSGGLAIQHQHGSTCQEPKGPDECRGRRLSRPTASIAWAAPSVRPHWPAERVEAASSMASNRAVSPSSPASARAAQVG
jgi:hypothetical protein